MNKGILHRFIRVAILPAFILVAGSIITTAPALHAQFLTLPVNLSYLSQRADVIVQGRVIDVEYEHLPGYENIQTVKVTMEVEDMLRGPQSSSYTFREALIGLKAREGKKTYHSGQRLLVFLPSPSRYGLSSPVGIEQGRFHIAINSNGEETIANELGNAGLFRNMDTMTYMAGMQLSQNRNLKAETTTQKTVRLDGFITLVRSLLTLPRIE